ncbi:MAG: NAD-dependent succinate-semialdehyde dehydrogenase [Acidimicrobiia bacterium]|nr:NAD-dependent succinate-semialdehyde dehydrogenase [Acidimicrobiia bacterium]NNF63281.1 NAD-dependent succinate-semialdehyde dehydrogenase [Acidimicrobiia bacterium]
MYIDGQWRANEATFPVFNPATGEKLADVADANARDLEDAIESAHRTFPEWSATTAYRRAAMLRDAYALMMERKEPLAKQMTEEQGKPLKAARNEVQYAADFLLWYSEEARRLYGSTIPAPRSDQRFIVAHQPIGVVGAITPWNYPTSMVTRKLAPALAAGCTVVLKPAEQTPLCAMEVFKILDEVGLPPGVANLVTTSNPVPVGEAFTSDRRIRKVTFTGSTEVGRILGEAAGKSLKRVSMELGGHAPFLVMADADPVHAAKGASLVKFLNTGQACISPNRMYVHRSIAEQFTAVLADRVSKMRAGNGLADGISVGPLVDDAAVEKVERQVTDAVDKGATTVVGGHRLTADGLEAGHFYAPTVLDGVEPGMDIYREETFGPVAPVIPFDDEDTVLDLANDTEYGLAAYVYTNDLSKAMRLFEGLRFGIVGINDINPTAAAAPFGGMGDSGLGREGGREGIAEYLETKLGGFSLR